jgi:fructokinase
MPLYGGIEGGGTKFVCAVGTAPDDVRSEVRFNTTTPEETLGRAIAFFREQHAQEPLAAIGIACFGPIDPHPTSPTFGHVTTTPKPGWAHTDVAGAVHQALGLPVGMDTDVNVAALGEQRWGAAQGLDTFIYLTVGTGIGGGGMANGELLHGLMHPEMGHLRVPHDWLADPYPGCCPYHGDCFEGLACGPAIEERWQTRGEHLPSDHPAWPLEAHYLALGLLNAILLFSPQRIVVGGGVMAQAQLLPMIHIEVPKLLNGYLQAPAVNEKIAEYIVPPALGARAGVLGAIALAERVLQGRSPAVGMCR